MTHFIVAMYLWMYLSLLEGVTKWKIYTFFATAVIGILIYPYLVFIIVIFYGCISFNLFYENRKKLRKALNLSFFVFVALSGALLVLMKSSFSSPHYSKFMTPMVPSAGFIFYAVKSILSYYANNSYVLVLVAFLFPIANVIRAGFKSKTDLNNLYLLWLACASLILFHVFVLFVTVNIFNPRHIGFLAVPFLAAVSVAVYNLIKAAIHKIEVQIIGLKPYAFTVLMVLTIAFSFSTRDFLYYLETGKNYHTGSNNYSESISLIMKKLDERNLKDSVLILRLKKDFPNYKFFHYRSGKIIVTQDDFQKIYYNEKNYQRIYFGFIYFDTIPKNELLNSIAEDYDFIQLRGNLSIIISKKRISMHRIQYHLGKILKIMN